MAEANHKNIINYAHQLAQDKSPAVRRAVAIALNDVPLEESKPTMLTLVDGYDGKDPWYVTALGIALEGKEEAFYPLLLKHFEAQSPANWSEALATLVWEFHPPSSVKALQERATSKQLSAKEREKALVALAFIPTHAASDAVRQLEKDASADLISKVQWWLQFRKTNDWQAYLKEWQSPLNHLPKGHPEMLKLRQQIANTALNMNLRLVAASKLAATKTGKFSISHFGGKQKFTRYNYQ